MAYKHIGKNFTPPDVLAKVTGKAKCAEDSRAEAMLVCRLFTSPMPHARVKNVDVSQAMNVKGVVAVLRASEVPAFPPPADHILTDEPRYVGDPILAVAATDEAAARAGPGRAGSPTRGAAAIIGLARQPIGEGRLQLQRERVGLGEGMESLFPRG